MKALKTHPDRAFARYIVNGLTEGFRIGFRRGSPLISARANMPSANAHPQVVTNYLQDELAKGRMLGPLPLSFAAPELQINRFGVIPKGHNTGKWRLITDLSFPPGRSVNDGVECDLCSLSYITVDTVAGMVANLGPGTLLAKVDIESAYRLIPVHPHDRPLQAVRWQDNLYIDPMLPFGLRSAPKVFTAVADAFQWFLQQQGIEYVRHYLDDYIILGPPDSLDCERSLSILLDSASMLGIPIASHKTAGPATTLTFLGIEIDTIASELRLPEDKRQRLQTMLDEWGDRRVCSHKELESLIGHLNHACKVVRSGRSFLRRIIDLLHSREEAGQSRAASPIRINQKFRADLAWWQCFMSQWNGVSFLQPPASLPSTHVYSDASGSWGCAARYGLKWFQVQWDQSTADLPIAVKELLPILIGCTIWGHEWTKHRVIWHCDNQTVVDCLKARISTNSTLMHLIRNLVYIEACLDFQLYPVYISTRDNHIADDLSRNRLLSFFSKVRRASRTPSWIPPQLVSLLLDPQADWICPRWRPLFNSTLRRAWHNQPRRYMTQPPRDSTTSAQSTTYLIPSQSPRPYNVASQPSSQTRI